MQAAEALLAHPQFWGALTLTLFTGIISTALSLICALAIVAGRMDRPSATAAYLAVPHLSLAIGLSLLIVPTGLIARLLALPLQWTAPPQWISAQDPHGVSLIAALVLKETPFLVFTFLSLLQRDDLRLGLQGQRRVAASLGHSAASTFARVVAPQLLAKAKWPIIAVFSYGMTVVDMALVIGPTQPPTLAQLVWTDLNDGDGVINARGAAGTFALCTVIILLLWVVGLLLRFSRPLVSFLISGYPSTKNRRISSQGLLWASWRALYALVGVMLLVWSISPRWPFPDLIPDTVSLESWARMLATPSPLITSLWLSLSAACVAVLLVMTWFEAVDERFDVIAMWFSGALLVLPSLVLGLLEYRLLLRLGLTGTSSGLFLVHLLPALGYVFIMLIGPYRGFDPRWQATSAGVGASRWKFLTQIKWPMLKGALLSAFAVGVAVAIAQYVPAQLAAAGRYSTLAMEAVTLSSGGNRALIATLGLTLALIPLFIFWICEWLGRPRFRIA